MDLKELKSKLLERIEEGNYNKRENCKPVYELKIKVEAMLREILSEIPDTEFEVYTGYKCTNGLNENRIYITPRYKQFSDRRKYLCEIQLHKTICFKDFYDVGYWVINDITITAPNKDVKFEEEYKLYEELCEKRIAEYEENKRKEAEERAAQLERNRIHAQEQAKLVVKYIKDNNLNEEEFLKFARIYGTYFREVEKELGGE